MKLGLGLGLNRFRGGQAGVVGLLDAYKGSAFAMSPDTLLYSTYSATDDVAGSTTNGDPGQWSVTVLRDSDNALRSFTPAEVADGTANTWVQAAGAANGLVRRGYDQSVTALDVSNLKHADQSDPTKMPKLFDSSTGLIVENGKAAIEFDGSNDFLITSSGLALPIYNFSVVKYRGIFNNAAAFFGQGVGRLAFGQGNFTPANAFWAWTPNVGSSYGEADSRDNLQHLHTYYTPSDIEANWKYYRDSVEKGEVGLTSGTPLTTAGAGLNIGYSGTDTEYWRGPIQLIITYPSDQSTNRIAIETAINNEYSIYP